MSPWRTREYSSELFILFLCLLCGVLLKQKIREICQHFSSHAKDNGEDGWVLVPKGFMVVTDRCSEVGVRPMVINRARKRAG